MQLFEICVVTGLVIRDDRRGTRLPVLHWHWRNAQGVEGFHGAVTLFGLQMIAPLKAGQYAKMWRLSRLADTPPAYTEGRALYNATLTHARWGQFLNRSAAAHFDRLNVLYKAMKSATAHALL